MKKDEAPDVIYLQINYSETGEELEPSEITWCEHKQHESDIEYLKSSCVKTQKC